MFKNKKSNLKVVEAQPREHKEAVRREKELESCEFTPAEIIARAREIRSHLENLRDSLAAVPFDIVAEEPGDSIRDLGVSVSDLVERLNPFLKVYRERCHDNLSDDAYDGFLQDYFGFLIAGQAETGFSIGFLLAAMVYGASEREIDKLERGLVHANKLKWWYREGSGQVDAARRINHGPPGFGLGAFV